MMQLRELERGDIPVINRWRQDRSLTAAIGAPHRHIGIEIDERWFESYLQRRGTDVRCAVCSDDNPELIGLVSLTNVDPVHKHAEYHILIGDRVMHGKGIGTWATREMLRHAFLELNLHRVYAFILASNPAARRTCEKAGFRLEGTMRQASFKGGGYHDVHLLGVLQSEYTSE